MTVETLRQKVDRIEAAIHSGEIEQLDRQALTEFNATLCNSDIGMYLSNNYLQVCETVRFNLLRTMAEAFEDRSKKAERWVMALAAMSLISSIAQIFSPMLFREPPIALVQPAPIVQLTCPSPVSPQACHQATKKKP